MCNSASSISTSVEDSCCFSRRYATSGILQQLHALPVHGAGIAAMYLHRSVRRLACSGFSEFLLAPLLLPLLPLVTLVTLLPACCCAGCVLGIGDIEQS